MGLQFKFEANQEYQLKAVEAVTDLLQGQPPAGEVAPLALGMGSAAAVPNQLDLDDAALLANLRAVQERNELAPDAALETIAAAIDGTEGPRAVSFPNFSVEMETGTGKTYVYLRTVLELYRRYGLRKFLIVVPSVAVREGVFKTLQVTDAHLRALYGNPPYRYYRYNSDNPAQVRQFALSNGIEIMVITIDSFNTATTRMRRATDRLQGEKPIDLVRASRPVLILDEPQNMESALSRQALAELDPLFALRYSATHRNPYNVVYRLTPADAYNQKLVKRIQVASVIKQDDENAPFLRVDDIRTEKKTVTARIALHQLLKDGKVKEKVVTVKYDDDLAKKAARPEYAGFVVDTIDPAAGAVRFKNNVEARKGETQGADRDALFEAQIRYTVEEHFWRQAKLLPQGIKILSLFFIDRVANYAPQDGIIRRLFIRAFDDLKAKPEYSAWRGKSADEVQGAYFAQRQRSGAAEALDSSGKSKEDDDAYELIMRSKERLLSLAEPVSFIFSHSALREGWDNPNVFQICTLNQTASEVKKRQEVGRGMRLAVDQAGDRIHDEGVNVLTIVANESYDRYAESLQKEIEEEYGAQGTPPKPTNARARGTATLRKAYTLDPDFQQLWERIKRKTRYTVQIDTDKLLKGVVAALDRETIPPPRVTITRAQLEFGAEGEVEASRMSGAQTALTLAGRHPLPNLVDLMAHLMEYTTPPVRLTRKTLLAVFERIRDKRAAIANPHAFATLAVRLIKEHLVDLLIEGIRYHPTGEWYELSQLQDEIAAFQTYLVPAAKSLYDQVICDSATERAFVDGLEKRGDVKLYVKLPGWFTVETPVGEYNPDWAIVMEDVDAHGDSKGTLYLVRETKSTLNLGEMRPDEARKIRCGERHFRGALGVDYAVATSADELPWRYRSDD